MPRGSKQFKKFNFAKKKPPPECPTHNGCATTNPSNEQDDSDDGFKVMTFDGMIALEPVYEKELRPLNVKLANSQEESDSEEYVQMKDEYQAKQHSACFGYAVFDKKWAGFVEERVSNELIDDIFDKATNYLAKIVTTLDVDKKLEFYGRFKQATVGDCQAPAPNFWDFKAKQKHKAWKAMKGWTNTEAKASYIGLLSKHDEYWLRDFKKNPKQHLWVSVSQPVNPEHAKPAGQKNIFDWVKEGNLDKVKNILATSREEAEEEDDDGLQPVHWAADRNQVEVCRALLEAGVDVNSKDGEGQTALHYASSNGHLDMIKLLLEKGVDVDAKDDDGITALEIADGEEVKDLLTGAAT